MRVKLSILTEAVSPKTREGARVVFNPNPVSAALYRHKPQLGEKGTVTSISLGSRRSTFLGGPGGGLLYVDWDNAGPIGISPNDVDKA